MARKQGRHYAVGYWVRSKRAENIMRSPLAERVDEMVTIVNVPGADARAAEACGHGTRKGRVISYA